jgi:Zn-dependent metalloprotease
MATKKPNAKKKTRSGPQSPDNGLKTFAMHMLDKAAAPMMAKLTKERSGRAAFALSATAIHQLDPETAAQQYLQQALQSDSVPSFTAPKSDGVESEFKSIGTEAIPLTGTTTVKFRQMVNKIPVYGTLVTVELDEKNNLVSMNSALGEPTDVNPVAKIAPADAVKAAEKYPGFRKDMTGIVPRMNYYFDKKAAKWRLVFILEDVPVTPTGTKKRVRAKLPRGKESPPEGHEDHTDLTPRYMDYIVDANTGKVVAQLPRTPSMAAASVSAVDGLGATRQITVETTGSKKLLKDTALNVQTFDFKNRDPVVAESKLPGAEINNPPDFSPSAVSAHANAAAVATFLRTVLRRNNIDNKGGPMNSSINCVNVRESPDGKQWFNAFWNGTQMVYGQRLNGTTIMSLSIDLDVVGHEMFHGVTDTTARLEYANQSGALNESFSDIFGIIIANAANPDPRTWNWKVGEGLSPSGEPFRDMSDPAKFGQPAHMNKFVVLSNDEDGDFGGVHTNSGIHNKAAFNILTAEDGSGNLVLTPQEVAAVFYLALTQQLSRTSQFSDSRRGALTSARTVFRNLPPDPQDAKVRAIEKGFTAVGIA